MSVQPSPAPAPAAPAKDAPKLEGQQLLDALIVQLNFYFSRDNLARDAFLCSQMNAQRFVPISVIGGFPLVKELTENKAILLEAMKACKTVVVDPTETMVRPNVRVARNTLGLRNMPADTPEAEVRSIFTPEQQALIQDIKADLNDIWFVRFDTEENCEDVAMDLNLSGKKFKGEKVRCFVKSENMQRGFFINPNFNRSNQSGWRPQYAPQQGGVFQQYNNNINNQQGNFQSQQSQNQQDSRGNRQGRRNNKGRNRREGNNNGNTNSRGGRKNRKNQQGGQAREGPPRTQEKPVQLGLGPDNFPALPKKRSGEGANFTMYTRHELDSIVNKIENESKVSASPPAALSSNEEVAEALLRSSPGKETQLLQTFPVMYPASPSPQLAAQPHDSADLMPYLDLNSMGGGMVYESDDAPVDTQAPAAAAPAAPAEQKQPAAKSSNKPRQGNKKRGNQPKSNNNNSNKPKSNKPKPKPKGGNFLSAVVRGKAAADAAKAQSAQKPKAQPQPQPASSAPAPAPPAPAPAPTSPANATSSTDNKNDSQPQQTKRSNNADGESEFKVVGPRKRNKKDRRPQRERKRGKGRGNKTNQSNTPAPQPSQQPAPAPSSNVVNVVAGASTPAPLSPPASGGKLTLAQRLMMAKQGQQ